jgi:hypothetical protein
VALLEQLKSPKNVVDTLARRQKMAGNEPGAKAILPEPRSVKKQFPISRLSECVPAVLILSSTVQPWHAACANISQPSQARGQSTFHAAGINFEISNICAKNRRWRKVGIPFDG